MQRLRVLTIEDDPAIRRGIVDILEFEGYQTLQADNGNAGLEMALQSSFDLLLLDLVLPGRDGLEILEEIRIARPTLPVIILTARGDESDRIRGLKLGADDYVVKPFSVRELAARVEAVLRRSPERPREVAQLALSAGKVDFQQQEVSFDDGTIHELSDREAETLRYLAMHADRVISRDELISRVWRIDPRGLQTRAIDMQIARLREKLRDHCETSRIIRTVRGKGYQYVGEPLTERVAGGPS